jgi:hypothetical protein
MSSSLPLSVTSLVHTLALSVGRDSPNLGTLSGRALVEQWLGARTHSSRLHPAWPAAFRPSWGLLPGAS